MKRLQISHFNVKNDCFIDRYFRLKDIRRN